MAEPLVILGAAGFGREVLDVVEAVNAADGEPKFDFHGFVDPAPERDLLDARGATWLGGDDVLKDLDGVSYVVGLGSTSLRRRLASAADAAGLHAVCVIHPSAAIGAQVDIGPGSVICSHVSITTNIRIGRHVHLNLNSTVGHDCVIGDFVTASPGVHLSGGVVLGDAAFLGTGAVVLEQLEVGAGATVGAGAVVNRSVDAGTTVVGVPARPRA